MDHSPGGGANQGAAADPMLVAVVYADDAYPHALLEEVVAHCRAGGIGAAGVLQHSGRPDAAGRCDVALEDLTTRTWTKILISRGPFASGCRLDTASLAEVAGAVARSLEGDPDILILNKFGKAESEGGGLLDLIGRALDRGCPVLVGVPQRYLGAWRSFAGDLSAEYPSDRSAVLGWMRRRFPAGHQRPARSA